MFCFKRQMWKWESVQVHSISSITSLRSKRFRTSSSNTHSPHCFQYSFLVMMWRIPVRQVIKAFLTCWSFFSLSDHSQGSRSQSHSFSSFSFTGFLHLFIIIISPHPSLTLKTQLKMRKLVLWANESRVTLWIRSLSTEHWKWWLGLSTDDGD